jgi:hypothetical protein
MVRWSAANAHRQIARKVDWSLTFHGFLRREIAEELRRRAPERRDRGDPRPAPGRGNRALQIAFGAPLGGSAFGAAPAPSRPEFEDMIDVPANIHRLPSRRP